VFFGLSCCKKFIYFVLKCVKSIGCAISLYVISPKMTLITLALLPGLVLFGTSFGAILRSLSKNAQKQVYNLYIVFI